MRSHPMSFPSLCWRQRGSSNKEIADYMYISVASVKTYLATIYQKIGITKRTDLKYYVNY